MYKAMYQKQMFIVGYCPICFEEIGPKIDNFCTYCGKDLREYQTICEVCGTGTHAWLWPSHTPPRCCMMCGTRFDSPHVIHPSFSDLPPRASVEVLFPVEEF